MTIRIDPLGRTKRLRSKDGGKAPVLGRKRLLGFRDFQSLSIAKSDGDWFDTPLSTGQMPNDVDGIMLPAAFERW
jgi:hypothetical protein